MYFYCGTGGPTDYQMGKRSISNYALLGIVSILIIISGFVRDSIFRNINWQINHYSTDNPVLVRSSFFKQLLLQFDAGELYILKWILTIFFSAVFLTYTVFGIRLVYRTAKYTKTIFMLFVGILTLSAISFGLGQLVGNTAKGYEYARIFMGAIQSPFILLILIPAIKLSKLKSFD